MNSYLTLKIMKNIIGLLIISFMFISVTYASFPVTEPAASFPVTEPASEPISGSFNWQAIVSAACLLVGIIPYTWYFLIPGLVFGILGISGDKDMKWLGWVGMIGSAVFLMIYLLVIAVYASYYYYY